MTNAARLIALFLGAGLAVAHPGDAVALNDTTVTANGGQAAGRDINNYGLTPEEVRALTEAVARGATAPLTTTIVDLSKRLGATEDATKTLLRIVGEQDVPLERLSETLNRVATDYKRLQEQAAALNPDNLTARSLVERAQIAITAGRLGEAHQLLAQARQAQIAAAQEARKLREQAQAAEDAQLLGAAASAATEGGVAMTERHYGDAADLFKQAASLVPPGHPAETANYLHDAADALYRQGDERGDNAALIQAIETWHLVLEQRPRDRVPLDWAETQNSLGNTLQTLGEREPERSGTARLEEAAAAYRAALEEVTRDRVPLDWARTQTNLGNALQILADREESAAGLEEAVRVYRKALEETTRDRSPLNWALTQNSLGAALERLGRLGERESGTARLEEAVALYRKALEEMTRDRVPLDWARSTGNQGVILMVIAERLSDVTKAQSAVEQIKLALETMRDGGFAPFVAYYEAQLSKARSLLDRLNSRSQ